MNAVIEMPKYKSHKEVWALKIKSIVKDGEGEHRETDGSAIITPEEEGYAPFKVDHAYMHKHKPFVGGYFVQYKDGYKSFSPADVFEGGNKRIEQKKAFHLDFSEALELLKSGNKVARAGWNGKNMFAVLSPGKKQLPSAQFFNKDLAATAESLGGFMDVRPTLMLKTAHDDVAYWVPSCSDLLADDWEVVM